MPEICGSSWWQTAAAAHGRLSEDVPESQFGGSVDVSSPPVNREVQSFDHLEKKHKQSKLKSSLTVVTVNCPDKAGLRSVFRSDSMLALQLKPGLSAYAKDPKAAADPLLPFLQKAENIVIQEVRQKTPVKVGATAGLTQLGVDASERILQALKDLLNVKSSFRSDNDWVTLLDGTQ